MAEVWQLSIIETSNSYLVNGVILRDPLTPIRFDNSWIKSAKYVIKTYFKKPLKNKDITIRVNKLQFETRTNNSGAFQVEMDKALRFDELVITYKGKELPVLQQYPVLFEDVGYDLVVISDIDETILQSFTRRAIKRISTTLFKNVLRRKTIEFTQSLYQFLKLRKARFFYVSKSESNLLQIIAGFIVNNNLPKGALLLTNYLNFAGLFKSKTKDFKFKQIDKIIQKLPQKKFVLIGDDSQKDPEIYARIAKKYPEKIFAVYIRLTSNVIFQSERNTQSFFENLNIPFLTYTFDQQFTEEFVSNNGTIPFKQLENL